MRKGILYILMFLTGVVPAFTSCQQDESLTRQEDSVPEGYVSLHFGVNLPSMPVVQTRGVDPDGGGVQNMTLFCFDSYGLFITTAKAEMNRTAYALQGSFNALVPINTKRIHFLANQNMTSFKESDFRNKSESEVMAVLEGSAGMMIYWGRYVCPDMTKPIKEQMPQEITLYRNQAKVNIENWSTQHLVVTGFAVCNTNAFGTVAPYNPNAAKDARWTWPGNVPFVTLPVNKSKLSDIVDVQTSPDVYVFECENGVDDPVSVIIRGHLPNETSDNDKYYRVMLVDGQGEQVLIRRNFHYRLSIKGRLSYGQNTFEDALTAAATNNVWVSISDEVTSVEDNDFILEVEKTNVVFPAPTTADAHTVDLHYTLTAKGNRTMNAEDAPSVAWLDGNTVAANYVENRFDVSGKTGKGDLTLNLFSLGVNEQKREGTLLVKKGHLQRKIKVITIKEQSFAPSWAESQVNGTMSGSGNNIKGANATLMFTVPESCPQELFPMRVLITVNDLDVRHESGMELPVVFRGDEGYGKDLGDKDCGYKYVYTVEKAGVQRIYFENILDKEEGDKVPVVVEADFFETLEQEFVFASHEKQITVSGLLTYRAEDLGEGFAKDEVIYYRLVPQKINAPVQFDMVMKNGETPINADKNDEFLLYAQNLTYYKNGEVWNGVSEFDCEFYEGEYADAIRGDIMAFRPKRDKLTPTETGKYSVYMKTIKAESAEVVNIASVQEGMYSPWTKWEYTGNKYRSVTFELANYNPFRFHATVGGVGAADFVPDVNGHCSAEAEKITSLTWDYEPGKQVDIVFDVTSFRGTDNKSADPFGTAFEIYIDAPMLEIDQARLGEYKLNSDKLREDPRVEGRFIYRVDAQRETERQFGMEKAYKIDATGVDQTGERKMLPFKKKAIVSAGNIILRSDKSKVVFFDKTFKVVNEPIRGKIEFTDMKPGEPGYPGIATPLKKGKFVIFELVSNGSRIGSMTIVEDGRYELRLRKEYKFGWENGEVNLRYTHDDGKVYGCSLKNLAELFKNKDLVLALVEE